VRHHQHRSHAGRKAPRESANPAHSRTSALTHFRQWASV
jgi:hypothetical protein